MRKLETLQRGESLPRLYEGIVAANATLTGEFRAELARADRNLDHKFPYKVHVWHYPDGVMVHLRRTFGNDAETVGTLNASLLSWFRLCAPSVTPDRVEHRVWANGGPNLVGGTDFYFTDERKALEFYARFASRHEIGTLH